MKELESNSHSPASAVHHAETMQTLLKCPPRQSSLIANQRQTQQCCGYTVGLWVARTLHKRHAARCVEIFHGVLIPSFFAFENVEPATLWRCGILRPPRAEVARLRVSRLCRLTRRNFVASPRNIARFMLQTSTRGCLTLRPRVRGSCCKSRLVGA